MNKLTDSQFKKYCEIVYNESGIKLTEAKRELLNSRIAKRIRKLNVQPGKYLSIIKKDPDDDKFIQCAEAGNANIIISGDSHLLALKSYHGITILTPTQFLEILE